MSHVARGFYHAQLGDPEAGDQRCEPAELTPRAFVALILALTRFGCDATYAGTIEPLVMDRPNAHPITTFVIIPMAPLTASGEWGSQ